MIFTNIYSKGCYPANKLSNFAENAFVFDCVPAVSMESLLQSFKFLEKDRQREVCLLSAKEAKSVGSVQKWGSYLFWNGIAYRRKGREYYRLLSRAYGEMAMQNNDFCRALIASAPILIHTIGKVRRNQTCLTNWEFCLILSRLKRQLLNKKKDNLYE